MMEDASYDVVIIGSGAGGGAAAWGLARRGVRVLLLEAGPAYNPGEDYKLHASDWELHRFPDKIPTKGRQTFAPLQKLEARWDDLRSWNKVSGRYNKSDRRKALAYSHVVGLGGSTLHYTGEAQRLNPAAMNMKSRFGVAADWPVDYAELEPWYDLAERVIGVAGPSNDTIRWRSAPYPLPAHPFSYASQKLADGFRALELGCLPNARAALSQPYDGRPPCNYCGNCARGCPVTDKGSADVTFIRKARATGHCHVRTGAQVTHLDAGADDRVGAVHYMDEAGRRQSVTGKAVIVACGAVETPRLLFNSANSHAAEGLANESGEVGRNFMELISWQSSGLHPEPLGSHRGLPADAICWDYNAPDAIPGVIGGCRFGSGVAEADLIGPVAYATRIVGGWGKDHRHRMQKSFGHALSVGAIGESLPNPMSFIDLDPDAKDGHGRPKARINSHLNNGELKRLSFMAAKTRQILKASGVESVFEEYGAYDLFNATHVFGTCRMGTDPATSVVDRNCRSHKWRNLYVIDASVFPSSGGGEGPSLTISALALRSTAHMVEVARRGEL